MKRLLLIPALSLPVLLYSCHGTKAPTALTPAVVIKQDHAAFPRAPVAPKPAPKKAAVKPTVHKRPKRVHAPLPPVAPEATANPLCPIANLPCPWRTN